MAHEEKAGRAVQAREVPSKSERRTSPVPRSRTQADFSPFVRPLTNASEQEAKEKPELTKAPLRSTTAVSLATTDTATAGLSGDRGKRRS
jgi:hypothetical protein